MIAVHFDSMLMQISPNEITTCFNMEYKLGTDDKLEKFC